jgi:D-alanyl-lipoteichoic acid acyltransferase DltB (MBOAT superfamily)
MAIGVAKIMGFEIPQNFTRPYLSENISEFWRKWHISLSSWVKDYIFIPLSQKLSLIQSKLNYDLKLKTMINVLLAQFVAIFLIGIWHGANWNFLIFSIYNGTFVVGYYLFLQFRKKIGIYKKVPLGSVMSKLLTLYVIMIGFLSFRIQDLNILLFSIKKLTFSITFSFKELLDILSKHRPSLIFLLIFTLVYLYYCKSDSNFSDKLVKLSVAYWSFVVLAGIFACLLLKPTIAQSFIYFQF